MRRSLWSMCGKKILISQYYKTIIIKPAYLIKQDPPCRRKNLLFLLIILRFY